MILTLLNREDQHYITEGCDAVNNSDAQSNVEFLNKYNRKYELKDGHNNDNGFGFLLLRTMRCVLTKNQSYDL